MTISVRPRSRKRRSSSQTRPRRSGSIAGRRLVEEQQGGIVDEHAGELETALHPTRQLPGPTGSDGPEVEELEDAPDPAPARPDEHPEQRADEVDVLADGQIREQHE